MLFQTYGDRNHPAVLFFHAMGVTGESSEPVVASSIGVDLAMAFLTNTKLPFIRKCEDPI